MIVKDVSMWLEKSFGGDGSLPMKLLLSPNGSSYYMKFGWVSEEPRTHLEHVNEIVAAKIAKLLQLDTIQAELALREGKYGCLALDFIEQYNATEDESGAVLLEADLDEKYLNLQCSSLKSWDLIKRGFNILEQFKYIDEIRQSFIAMNLFDILIGNQDRHPSNWVILFKSENCFFGPLFDNGASLGFQLPDARLEKKLENDGALDRYYARMKVKGGIFKAKNPPVKAADLLKFCILNYNEEVRLFKKLLIQFPSSQFETFVNNFPLYSRVRKDFVKQFVEHRRGKILSKIREGL